MLGWIRATLLGLLCAACRPFGWLLLPQTKRPGGSGGNTGWCLAEHSTTHQLLNPAPGLLPTLSHRVCSRDGLAGDVMLSSCETRAEIGKRSLRAMCSTGKAKLRACSQVGRKMARKAKRECAPLTWHKHLVELRVNCWLSNRPCATQVDLLCPLLGLCALPPSRSPTLLSLPWPASTE